MKIEEIKNLGETPIPGDAPAGQDVSYEPDFEALSDEIKKLSSPTAEGAINWQHITELGVSILRDESKNLVVACYLNVGLLYTDGMEGFASGVHVLRTLLETWWDTMYPPKKRKKGRINILNWWDEKLRQLLPERENETWPSEQRQQLLDDISAIDTLLADKLEDGPMLRGLENAVGRLLDEKIEEAEVEPEPEPVVEQATAGENDPPPEPQITPPAKKDSPIEPPPKPVAQPEPTPAPATPTDEADDEYLNQGLQLLGRAVWPLFQADPSQVLPYQLSRIVAWSGLETLPAATGGLTLVRQPEKQIVSLLEEMAQSEKWENLLSAAESRIREHKFWLDLSYYSATALRGLDHSLAAQAVENETRLHVLRLANIETLSFKDNLPFASQKTRSWLHAVPTQQTESAPPGSDQEHSIGKDVEEAAQLCSGSGMQVGLSWLVKQKKTAGSPRREFMYEIGLCQLLLQVNRLDMALSFSEKIIMTIDLHGLEKWEPKLAVQGLVAACQCLGQAGDEEVLVQQRKKILDRITLLAPEQALTQI